MKLDKNCSACRLDHKSGCKSPRLKPFGPKTAKYLVVGSSPTAADDTEGKLFSKAPGATFKELLKDLGIPLEEVAFTAAVRCKPSGSAEVSEIELCGETVRGLIEEIEPDSVLCLGANAVRAVFPKAYRQAFTISRIRGSQVPYFTKSGKAVTCVATYSPSFFSGGADESLQQVWYDDIASLLEPVEIKVPLDCEIILCKKFPQIKECAEKLKTKDIVAFDYETTELKPYGQAGKAAELFSVAFAFDDGTSYAIPLFNFFPSNMQRAIIELVGDFFYNLNPSQRKIAHNTKFDMLWGMYKAGKKLEEEPKGIYEDTSLLCWMADGRPGMSKLKVAGWKYLGAEDWSVDVKNVRSLPLDDVLRYNALDSFYTLRLYQHLEPLVCEDDEKTRLYRELLLPAMLQFLKIEMRGVPVEEETRSNFYTSYQNKLEELRRAVRQEAGNLDLNPASPLQLQKYFVNTCKYTMLKKIKSGWSTDAESMEYLIKEYSDGVAKKLLEYKAIDKLQSTYIAGMTKHIYSDGKLHGGFNLTATITGRTSSSEPNMQNFPKRKAKEVRGIVTAPPGHKICSFDYGQIEARLFAVVTGDEKYLDDLYNGYDIHLEKALWVYRDKLGWTDEDARAQRGAIKNGGVFPAFYGAGDYNISKSLGISQKLARDFKESIFGRYPKVKKWQAEIVALEEQTGYLDSLYGRRRRAPMKYNELLNFTMQSTASDMTLTAMNFLGRKYKIAFMIHDDLSIFLPDDETLSDNIDFICDAMLVLPWLFLAKSKLLQSFAPLQIECEVGDNWANQKPVKNIDSVEAGYTTLEGSLARAEEVKAELLKVGW